MEHIQNSTRSLAETYAVPILFAIIGITLLVLWNSQGGNPFSEKGSSALSDTEYAELLESVTPLAGVELPVRWNDLGVRLVESGVIDRGRWIELYGSLSEEERHLLDGNSPEKLRITRENAPYLLNLLWALGLANKNPILEDKTEMMNPEYGGASNFASTGGWTIGKGDPMDHYNMHSLTPLTPGQQDRVDRVARGIYRPCCGNPVHFPDCNHGMAMLGLLELMASQDVSEEEMYKAALAVNSYWFPDTYQTIAQYLAQSGVEWSSLKPQEILGAKYSGASGFAKIVAAVETHQGGGGSSCGV